MANEIKIRVPATTANCGAGFDCLGIACTYYNLFTFEVTQEAEIKVQATGEGAEFFSPTATNLAIDSLLYVFKKYNLPAPLGISLKMHNNIPLSRGLGSSSSAIVAGVIAGNYFAKLNLDKEELLVLANDIEGHPDNVAPALLGGITLSYIQKERAYALQVEPKQAFKLVAIVPELKLATVKARAVLPEHVSMQDAIFNLSRAALFVLSIQSGELDKLEHALNDCLHQPYRQQLIPGMREVFTVAKENGAYGAVISGAGSTLMAFCPLDADCERIGESMQAVFTEKNINSVYHVFDVDMQGAVII